MSKSSNGQRKDHSPSWKLLFLTYKQRRTYQVPWSKVLFSSLRQYHILYLFTSETCNGLGYPFLYFELRSKLCAWGVMLPNGLKRELYNNHDLTHLKLSISRPYLLYWSMSHSAQMKEKGQSQMYIDHFVIKKREHKMFFRIGLGEPNKIYLTKFSLVSATINDSATFGSNAATSFLACFTYSYITSKIWHHFSAFNQY